jgi:hypothetical protein
MNATNPDRDALLELRRLRREAPPDFARRVMDALPLEPDVPAHGSLRQVWPEGGRWFLPALAGAAAALLLATFAFREAPLPSASQVTVHFEIHAPNAESVELVGTFTDWRAGQLRLEGPDASGHWTAAVELPEGRHEYGFLVDGQRWVADPRAEVRRADGFGRENAVIEL